MVYNTGLWIEQDNPKKSVIIQQQIPELQPNQVLIKLVHFGLTTNNITYVGLETHGHKDHANIPVWGVGVIVKSTHNHLKTGERIYGYFPITQFYILTPNRVSPSFFDVLRPQLPVDRYVYNQYFRANGDPEFSLKQEEHMMIYRPLWTTSFFLEDFLTVHHFFNSDQIIISSASSKTSYCLALLLQNSKKNKKVIGLTSKNNLNFVNHLGLYDKVVTYDQLEKIDSNLKVVYVDVAGNLELNHKIERYFQTNLMKLISAGMSHFESGQKPTFNPTVSNDERFISFFAPSWIQKRFKESKNELIVKRKVAWNQLLAFADRYIKLTFVYGPIETEQIYLNMLNGHVEPNQGFVISLFDNNAKL
ncbi:hypothetical protein HDV02_001627 [Globomyces sp. JEL0801]|nr:hypothetical protein HDV02_001627 [Globomyces sp. JEL0801]